MYKYKITIVTVTYNNIEGLRKTVPSVISQTYPNFEYIVIDGGSTDGSLNYLEKVNGIDKLISEPDNGVYDAMNKGVMLANGEFILFMNAGDLFFSPLVLEQTAPQLQDADYYTGNAVFVEKNQCYTVTPPTEMSLRFLMCTALSHQASFSRTSVLKSSLYDTSFKLVSDWAHFTYEWYAKARKYHSIDCYICIYFMDGLSSTNAHLLETERNTFILRLCQEFPTDKLLIQIHKKLQKQKSFLTQQQQTKETEIQHTKKLHKKLENAMKMSPVERDLKIIRNGIKALVHDLFV